MLGVIVRDGGVLVAWRDEGRHQGGCLEFPGGKVKSGESPEQALRRELMEEIGVAAEAGAPLIRFTHDYGDRRLLLDVREARIEGDPARSKRRLEWRPIETLSTEEFPPANNAILNALKLPSAYAITSAPAIEQSFGRLLESGVRLILLRAKELDDERYQRLARHFSMQAHEAGAQLLLHDRPGAVEPIGAAGVHLSQAAFSRGRLRSARPVSPNRWFAVSCHNLEEVCLAEAAGADFCVLGPVRAVSGHAEPLGFDAFEGVVACARIPVYALGGMSVRDIAEARMRGAQGIAGVRCFVL